MKTKIAVDVHICISVPLKTVSLSREPTPALQMYLKEIRNHALKDLQEVMKLFFSEKAILRFTRYVFSMSYNYTYK